MTTFTSDSNPIAAIAEQYFLPLCKDMVEALTIANSYADFVLHGSIFPNYWHQQTLDWLATQEVKTNPLHRNVTAAIEAIHVVMVKRVPNTPTQADRNAEALFEARVLITKLEEYRYISTDPADLNSYYVGNDLLKKILGKENG